jgi:hypothetical protein
MGVRIPLPPLPGARRALYDLIRLRRRYMLCGILYEEDICAVSILFMHTGDLAKPPRLDIVGLCRGRFVASGAAMFRTPVLAKRNLKC